MSGESWIATALGLAAIAVTLLTAMYSHIPADAGWPIVGILFLGMSYSIYLGKQKQKGKSPHFISREGTATVPVQQAKMVDIELPSERCILHQLKIVASVATDSFIQVCESSKTFEDRQGSCIYERRVQSVSQTLMLGNLYYEDKDGGARLHLQLAALRVLWLREPPREVTFQAKVWCTPC